MGSSLNDKVRSRWFLKTTARPNASIRLFCFPYAGGSAAIYNQWANTLPKDVEVVPVELPGRGSRIKEAPMRRFPSLVTTIADAIPREINGEFAFFGHSMGALLAFELARELRRRGQPLPGHLFVSGRGAPQLPDRDPPTYDLPEPEFIAELKRLNGTPKEVLEHQELMDLLIPLLRADFELIQTCGYTEEAPLDCPMTAYGGAEDYEVPRDDLVAWKAQTTGAFAIHILRGDHFFLRSAQSELLRLLSASLFDLSRRARVRPSQAAT